MCFFSNFERVEMLLIFGECKRNSREATKVYRDRFPQRKQPSEATISTTVNGVSTTVTC